MIFSNFTKSISGSTILFKNTTPIEYVERLKYYKDDSLGTFTKKEFRWSFDNRYWASWETLSQGNISSINIRNNRYLYFEIRYVKSNPSSTVNKFTIDYLELPNSEQSSTISTSTTIEETETITINTDNTDNTNIVSETTAGDLVSRTFSTFIKSTSGSIIYLKNLNPLQYVNKIKFFKDDSSGTFTKKEFRWSFNKEYWSSWYTLNQGNVSSIDTRSNQYLFFEFRYVKSNNSADVNKITISYLLLESAAAQSCEIDSTPTPTPTPIDRDYTTTDKYKTTVLNVNNADELCGQSCDYYLSRPNHKGQQPISSVTDLQKIIDNITTNLSSSITGAENVNGDGIGLFYNVSGNDLLFKRLIAGEGAILNDSSGIITVAVDPCIINRDPSINNLQIKNVGDSSASIYYSRTDTSSGITFNFRGLRGANGISVYNSDKNIIIDASLLSLNVDQRLDIIDSSIQNLELQISTIDLSIERVDLSLNYLYGQIGSYFLMVEDASIRIYDIDISIIDLYNNLSTLDSSILRIDSDISTLNNYVLIINSSINDIQLYQNIQDSSIYNTLLKLDLVEDSVNYLDSWNLSQDSSIEDLRNKIINLDTSIYRDEIDTSLDKIREDVSILTYDLSQIQSYLTVIDSSIIRIDSSLFNIYNILETIDTSIVYLNGKISSLDSSIIRIDSDISIINSDVSILQSDILNLDSSVKYLFDYEIIQDNSINYLTLKVDSLDSSILRIDTRIEDIDSSINRIDIDLNQLDSSIIRIDSDISLLQNFDTILESSIARIDSDISTLYNKDIVIDSSIIRIDSDISTLYNKDIIIDSSIIRIDSDMSTLYNKDVVIDSSIIRIDSDISILQNVDTVLDSSIVRIDSNIDSIEASIALIIDDQVINIGEGSIGIYSIRDSCNNILLKTINQIGPVEITQDTSTILIDSSIVKLYDTSLANSVYAPTAVGGFELETSIGSIKKDTYTSIIDELLFPTVEPSISLPTSVFSMAAGGLFEVDQNISVTFNIQFIDGSIMVGDVYQGISSGQTLIYNIVSNSVYDDVSISTDRNYIHDIDVDLEEGYNIFDGWVEYSQGPVSYDNKGNSYSYLPEGSTNIETFIIETTYPFFSNYRYINTVEKEPSLYSMVDGNDVILEFAPEVGVKGKFDIAEDWGRPIVGIQTFMPWGNDWEYQGGDASTSLTYWDTSTGLTHNIQGINVDYIRYTYNGVDRGRTKIRLKF